MSKLGMHALSAPPTLAKSLSAEPHMPAKASHGSAWAQTHEHNHAAGLPCPLCPTLCKPSFQSMATAECVTPQRPSGKSIGAPSAWSTWDKGLGTRIQNSARKAACSLWYAPLERGSPTNETNALTDW